MKSNSLNLKSNGLSIQSKFVSQLQAQLKLKLGPYLVGLIEANGSFAIHDKNSKAKKYQPKILIVFNLNGNFIINLTDRKKRDVVTTKRVVAFFRIELKQNSHRNSSLELGGTSYFNILSSIARYLGANLNSRSREGKNKIFYSYKIISYSLESHIKVIEYFDRFPLYSSKYLVYKD